MTDAALVFLKGLMLGLSIAAPVGPIGLLCVRRSLEAGFWPGLAGGLGTAVADAVYAAIAAFGVTAVSNQMTQLQGMVSVIGGGMLIWIGLFGMTVRPPSETTAPSVDRSLWRTFAGTFLLTMANPATILPFAAIYAGLGLAAADSATSPIVLVVGVFMGSLLWWAILSGAVSILRLRISAAVMVWINRASGAFLVGFGASLLLVLL